MPVMEAGQVGVRRATDPTSPTIFLPCASRMGVLYLWAPVMYFTAGGKRSPWLGSVLSDSEAWPGPLSLPG